MIYEEHIEAVIQSLRKFSKGENTDLVLLKNHLEQITKDVIIENDKNEKNSPQADLLREYRDKIKHYEKALSIIANEEYTSIQTNHSAKMFLVKVAKEALEQ